MLQEFIDGLGDYISRSVFLAYLAVYVGGFLVSLTPCVYPVIPINVAYIGGQSKGSRLIGLLLSLCYALGMAVSYTLLGCFAALTGRLFGEIQTNPWIYLIVGNVCILLGLSMFDVFFFPMPSFLNRFQPKGQSKGLIGSFLVGFASGFIVGPCTAPVLGVLLSYVATRQSILYGTSLLFVFAIGMGTLMIILGSFAGLLSSLPNAGTWMVKIKKGFGWVLIGIGEYFLVTAGMLW